MAEKTTPTTATPATAAGTGPAKTAAWQQLADLATMDVPELSPEALRIDTDPKTAVPAAPGEDREMKVLDRYRQVLDARTKYHFGYPYNLAYNHQEIWSFMQYSINNVRICRRAVDASDRESNLWCARVGLGVR